MAYKEYLIDPKIPEDFRVVPQNGVSQYVLEKSVHNACWDSIITPEGRIFFSFCSELTTSDYGALAEFCPKTGKVDRLFYSRDYIGNRPRAIRDSKIHTSLAVRNDGTLIMATHTTDKAPGHPAWLPEGYFGNLWEGYPGSTMFLYDPKSGAVTNLGVQTPGESVYGACYDRVNDVYYMLGFLRGHLYRYRFSTGATEDLGQVVERGCYRIVCGPDNNLYFSTRSGALCRVNTATEKIEHLGIRLPDSCREKKMNRSYLCAAAAGPDGRLYLASQFHETLSALDVRTNTLEELGSILPTEKYMNADPNHAYVGCMAFDGEGVLWMCVCGLRHNGEENYKPAASLVRWDVCRGGMPESLGLLGTPERLVTTSVSMFIRDDIMTVIGGNHADEGLDFTVISLPKLRESAAAGKKGPVATDRFVYPDCKDFEAHAENLRRTWSVIRSNSAVIQAKRIVPLRLWEAVPLSDIENSSVRRMAYRDGRFWGVCGNSADRYAFSVLPSREKLVLEPYVEEKHSWICSSVLPGKYAADLPAHPGRQYLAEEEMRIPLPGGRSLSATRNGYLSILSEEGVFALGKVCDGPVRDMTVTATGRVYGVAGDEDDLGMVFSYDDVRGLRRLGRLGTDGWEYGIASSCLLRACVWSEDDGILAVGAGDRLGCVYLLSFC